MKNMPLYKIIKDNLIKLILENHSTPQYMLPSENQLSRKFNASRISVRKALSELETEGIIYKIKGKGSMVKSNTRISSLVGLHKATDTFALIVPDITSSFLVNICHGIQNFCNEKDIDFVIFNSQLSSNLEQKNINRAMQLKCKGLIIMPVDEDKFNDGILSLTLSKHPAIFIDRKLFGIDVSCVSSNHYSMGFYATKYLAKYHKNIALLSLYNTISSVAQRIEGYEAAVSQFFPLNKEKYMLDISDYMCDPENSIRHMHDYFNLNPKITGIIVNSGNPALYAVKAMTMLNKKLGTDYEIVVFDNDSYYLEQLYSIKIPAILQDDKKIGLTAARSLYDLIYEGKPTKDVLVPLKADLEF